MTSASSEGGVTVNLEQLLSECVADQSTVLLTASGVDVVFQTKIKAVEASKVIVKNPVPPDLIRKVVAASSYGLQAKMVRFLSDRLESDGENIIFPFSELKEIEETRQAERFSFEEEEAVVCEILNPYDQKTILTKSVLDMSATGLSIRLPRPSKLFVPGTFLGDIKVLIAGEPYTKAAALVVYNRTLVDYSGKMRVQVGLKLENK